MNCLACLMIITNINIAHRQRRMSNEKRKDTKIVRNDVRGSPVSELHELTGVNHDISVDLSLTLLISELKNLRY